MMGRQTVDQSQLFTGGSTMAIDTGAIETAVALTAACRTTVANVGIRTRVAETCG